MNIIVCIKQVPDTSEVKIDRETNTLIRKGVPSIINPFDKNALEEALRLREKHGGKVTVVSMGPPQAQEALREAIAMGADEAILLSDKAFAGADTFATSITLATAIKKIGSFDLILCGKQAIDGDTAQVGPELGEILNIPVIPYVRKITIEDGKAMVESVMEDGYEAVEVDLPLLITVNREINEPRHPSLRGVLVAKKKEIPIWGVEKLEVDKEKVGLKGSPTQVIKVFTLPPKEGSKVLQGDPGEVVKELIGNLKETKII
ncbi:electron transfer flavoprotein subunit beta/FixA family protein [bacterium]|nr:electron transfer flavoprotein subunit beta/FixA family protein [bacterium]MBU0900153.1 electron transfer flavoprotein subunit beta/FixA family protein [bacterium]MBU1154123.1 electron transfer flavoprotein subunit beta/FixA family protein [bacterium]MBU1782436.1 electron transfer flavoprotein subunit beta/FixA family protein [bacterium]